jgi:hypothetical protein
MTRPVLILIKGHLTSNSLHNSKLLHCRLKLVNLGNPATPLRTPNPEHTHFDF